MERLVERGPGRRSGTDERATAGMGGFLLGAAAMFAVTYSTQAILPALSAEFGVSPARAGLSISVVVVALGLGAWIWGPFSDRYGRKPFFMLGATLFVIASALCGAAGDLTFLPIDGMAQLIVFRGIQGVGGGMVIGILFTIDNGERQYIERIVIRGNNDTREYVFRREFDIAEGDAYNRALVERAEKRLRALAFVKSLKITPSPGSATRG